MLRNYFNTILRNLAKSRTLTTINISGLALGMAIAFIISVYIRQETSYDKFHHQPDLLYRVVWENENPQTRTPHPMAQALADDFPEIENAVSISPLWTSGLTRETHSFRNPEKNTRFDEANILAVDTTFFQVFDFPIVKGDPKHALKKPGGLLISESIAKKYFGDQDPIGKHLSVDGDQYLIEVVAVFKDVPKKSHFHFDFLVSYIREKTLDPDSEYYSWKDFGHFNYIRLKPGADAKKIEASMMDWSRKYINWTDEQINYFKEQHYGFKLQPVVDIHLKSRLRWELESNGNINYLYILATAAILTLVIACVNFINLTIAKSAERAKEIGIRKTMGAFRLQLSLQFLLESIAMSLLASVLAAFIVQVSLPLLRETTGFSVDVTSTQYPLIFVCSGIAIGIIAGLYPAIYLTQLDQQLILKGKFTRSQEGTRLRQGLIVFQFSLSMILLSSCFIIYSQLNFLKTRDLGFDKEEVLIIPIKNDHGFPKFENFRNELLKMSGIVTVSATSNIPGRQFNQNPIALSSRPNDFIDASEAYIDYDFFKVMNIELLEGSAFLPENGVDSIRRFIVNETAAKGMNPSGPIVGQEMIWDHDGNITRGKIIGVVKDFHFQSLHEPIRPLFFTPSSVAFNHIVIKMNTTDISQKLSSIEKVYKNIEPYFAFEYSFLEDRLNDQYESEQVTASVLGTFSVISALIACFGLFGISMLTFLQRLKEISVRKVLGASSLDLLVTLLGNFTKLILISIVLSIPIVWIGMNKWMGNFSYQLGVQPLIFLEAGLALLLLSWITLSYFTIKASRVNPAETLKSE